jgi:hypothetical protein
MGAPNVSIVECAPHFFASVRRTATAATFLDTVISAPVWSRKLELGLQGTGLAVIVFPDGADAVYAGDSPFTVDFGLEVTEPFADDPILTCRTTPTGRAAEAEWVGPYTVNARATHEAVRDWCKANGHTLAGPVFELHRWNQDPALHHTRIYYPLA